MTAGAATESTGGPARAHVPVSLRSLGVIDLAFADRDRRTFAARTFQSGSMRVRIPRMAMISERPCAVLINTAGGLAEGDRIDLRVTWGANSQATVATQAAEKVYRSLDLGAQIGTQIEVGPGACAEWLPQETILFDRSRLSRDIQIRLVGNATFLGLEATVLGRQAMGEAVLAGQLDDRIRIWRDDRLIYADSIALNGAVDQQMAIAAIGDGARAMAVLIRVGAGADERLAQVRERLVSVRGTGAASAWNDLLAVRLLAADGETLRHDIADVLTVLRDGRPLPRVWRC